MILLEQLSIECKIVPVVHKGKAVWSRYTLELTKKMIKKKICVEINEAFHSLSVWFLFELIAPSSLNTFIQLKLCKLLLHTVR